ASRLWRLPWPMRFLLPPGAAYAGFRWSPNWSVLSYAAELEAFGGHGFGLFRGANRRGSGAGRGSGRWLDVSVARLSRRVPSADVASLYELPPQGGCAIAGRFECTPC